MSRIDQHHCEAVAVACIDFRFQDMINRFLEEKIGEAGYDRIGVAGVTKNLPFFLEQLAISVRLHHPKRVIIIHHEECGAYGQESTSQKHTQELLIARKAIVEQYPDMIIELIYLRKSGVFETITPSNNEE